MFLEAPCCSRTLMASAEFQRAAWWSGVVPSTFGAFTFAPFCNSNSTMYFLLLHDARCSAVQSSSSRLLTGIPSFSILTSLRVELLSQSWEALVIDLQFTRYFKLDFMDIIIWPMKRIPIDGVLWADFENIFLFFIGTLSAELFTKCFKSLKIYKISWLYGKLFIVFNITSFN